ncbi:MAG: hypothetical protein LQ337_004023 [Flavoplaca oasis]|nr:MAG: hypothetical protein LQ337_004023 [Flavoplaca oasis]
MPLFYSPITIRKPIRRPFQTPKALSGSTGPSRFSETHGSVRDRHHYLHFAATQRRQAPRKRSNETDSEHLSSDSRQNNKCQILFELRSEKLLLDDSLAQLQTAIYKATDQGPFDPTRTQLLALQQTLQMNVMALKDELENHKDLDPRQLERKKVETAKIRASAERWTNNIELLEGWFDRMLAKDPSQLDRLRRECYGAEYIEGEGLKEL